MGILSTRRIEARIDAADSCQTATNGLFELDRAARRPSRPRPRRSAGRLWVGIGRESPRAGLWVDECDRFILLADHPDAASAARDRSRRRSDRDLIDDVVRRGIDDSDRVRQDCGEAARFSAAGQLDHCDADGGSEENDGACNGEQCSFAAGPLPS